MDALPLKSGALQGAIAIDYVQENRFESVHIVYDGVNGQLPNLDLINSVVSIASGQMGIGTAIQEMWRHSDKYEDRLKTMLRGMLKQGLGLASGPHSSFIPYHVDAVTLQPFGEGWQDEMAMGRVIEGTFRSLNNLLEHLHQSFFFYLLMHKERFVSIGTYLPSAMAIAANFTIVSIALWVGSGMRTESTPDTKSAASKDSKADDATAAPPAVERHFFLPLGVVSICQFLGVVPLYLFNHLPASVRTLPKRLCPECTHANPNLGSDASLLRLLPCESWLASSALVPSDDVLQAIHPAIYPDPVILAIVAGDVSFIPGNVKLFAGIPGRPAGQPLNIHEAFRSQPCVDGLFHCLSEPDLSSGNLGSVFCDLWPEHWRCAQAGCVRLGYLGHVYADRCLVCVVAGMAGGLNTRPRPTRRLEGEDGMMKNIHHYMIV